MFWEQQLDNDLRLGIIQLAIIRERFKFISKHIAYVTAWESDDSVEDLFD